jgi:transcriptional pleiotropic regulator of transition state genes
MTKGIIKKMDPLGRVTVPMEYRKTAGINAFDRVGLELHGSVIHVILPSNMGKFVGIDRPFDELGRITLPIEMRTSLNFEECQKVDLYFEGNVLCIKKVGCHYCGKTELLKEFKGFHVCNDCADELHGRFRPMSA